MHHFNTGMSFAYCVCVHLVCIYMNINYHHSQGNDGEIDFVGVSSTELENLRDMVSSS